MYLVRLWSVRHARGLQWSYAQFEKLLVFLHPLFAFIGYERIEKPVALFERLIKKFLFDCQMCGQCALSDTGMSCPMNCPKNIRNGPCGGVRENGMCEVNANMRCVWLEAFAGSNRMKDGLNAMRIVQIAVDRRLQNRSSWLQIAKTKGEAKQRLKHANNH